MTEEGVIIDKPGYSILFFLLEKLIVTQLISKIPRLQ
jgi:hypothetical protein